MNGVEGWFGQFPGSLLLEQEQASMTSLLSGVFGYYLVQGGSLGGNATGTPASHIRSRIVVTPKPAGPSHCRWIKAVPDRLPIASDSVDVVLLPHTLDFYPEPHQTLREADRVLIPEGRLIIIGFNPWSLWGLWRLFRCGSGRAPWTGRFIAPGRMHDWLSLLGFEVEVIKPSMFRPPLRQQALMERLQLLESAGARWWPALSGVYILRAVKRVSTLTPVKPAWKLRRSILAGRAVEPTTRECKRG